MAAKLLSLYPLAVASLGVVRAAPYIFDQRQVNPIPNESQNIINATSTTVFVTTTVANSITPAAKRAAPFIFEQRQLSQASVNPLSQVSLNPNSQEQGTPTAASTVSQNIINAPPCGATIAPNGTIPQLPNNITITSSINATFTTVCVTTTLANNGNSITSVAKRAAPTLNLDHQRRGNLNGSLAQHPPIATTKASLNAPSTTVLATTTPANAVVKRGAVPLILY